MSVNVTKDSIDIGLVTGNIEAMTIFYRDRLGLPEEAVLDMPGGTTMTRLVCGTTIVKLLSHAKTPDAANPPGGIGGGTGIRYFTITVDNLDEATAACQAAGHKIAITPREIRPGIKISMIEDPDGNWVELLQPS